MTTRREFLTTATAAAAAVAPTAVLPRKTFGQTVRAASIRTKDGTDIFIKDTGIVLTERDRMTRDLLAFAAS